MNTTNDETEFTNESFESEFEKLYEESFKEPREGELVTGTIVKVTNDSVVVDIGCKSEGLVPLREFVGPDEKHTLEIGQELTVLLERWEDEMGYVVLSKIKADQLKIWDELIEIYDNDNTIDGEVVKCVKGGFHVDISGLIAFLPNSQADLRPVRDPETLLGSKLTFKVLKYNRRKNNVIISRRVLLEKERESVRKETLATMEEGLIVDGIVKNITDYGAFLDLGGVDGLVHLSDLSWGKVTHPSQIVKIGDTIKVKVLKFDKEENKISLGLKQTRQDPWQAAPENYPIGTKVHGKVVNLTDYGAFVEVEQGLEGLIHISEMSWTKIRHPSQKLKVGQEIDVVVLDMDTAAKRLSLGLKQVEVNPWDELADKYPAGSKVTGIVKNITDFGMFVGIEAGIDGLVHISDLSWKKVKNPSEVFKKGQEVEAIVLNIDKKNHRFSLSTKVLEKNPWDKVEDRYNPGMIIQGKITSVADFGAFVELEEGLEGLVHISELNRGQQKGTGVNIGDIIEVEILNVNPDEKKIGLSIRQIVETAKVNEPTATEEEATPESCEAAPAADEAVSATVETEQDATTASPENAETSEADISEEAAATDDNELNPEHI
jgi:small subunit ribosomal protein S1